MGRVDEHNNFIIFTAFLVLMLLCSALAQSLPEGMAHILMRAIVISLEVVAFISLKFGGTWRRFVIAMFCLIFAANILDGVLEIAWMPVAGLLITLVFVSGVIYWSARHVLFSGVVEMNTIIGALAIYLLLGLLWATLYLLTLELFPGAFNGIDTAHWADNYSKTLYFSYVTMTSLGYGDISPAIPLSRTLAYLQAVAGAFYMAIVVASLVGARKTNRDNLE